MIHALLFFRTCHERFFQKRSSLKSWSYFSQQESLLQLIQVERSRHELNLIEATLRSHSTNSSRAFRERFPRPSKSPCGGISAKSIVRFVLAVSPEAAS